MTVLRRMVAVIQRVKVFNDTLSKNESWRAGGAHRRTKPKSKAVIIWENVRFEGEPYVTVRFLVTPL